MDPRPRIRIRGTIPLALGILLSSPALAAPGPKPVVAVFDLENRAKLKKGDVLTLTEYITTRLAEGGLYRVVPKGEVQSALRTKKAESYQSCYDESCQIEIGRELAAQKTLSSKVSQLGSTCIVTVQLYDLAQSASEGAGTSKGGCKVEQILGLLDEAIAPIIRPAAVSSVKASPSPSSTPTPAPEASSAAVPRATDEAPRASAPAPELPPEVADLPMPKPPSNAAELDQQVRGLPFMRSVKARELLMTEIQGLERLLASTRKDAPDRPQLMFRLATGYGELEFAARREAPGRDGSAQKVEAAARSAQIKHLQELSLQYPSYPQMDEVHYTLGLAYERAQNFESARKTMFTLVKNFPASTRVPFAYLFFAQVFLRESKLDLADQAFAGAEKFPAVSAYARYGRVWVAVNQNNREAALGHLFGARKRAEALPDTVQWKAPLLAAIQASLSR